jgi:hypothetical protein
MEIRGTFVVLASLEFHQVAGRVRDIRKEVADLMMTMDPQDSAADERCALVSRTSKISFFFCFFSVEL